MRCTWSPTTDLNHCRSCSTRLTRAIGARKMVVTSLVMSSNLCGGTARSKHQCADNYHGALLASQRCPASFRNGFQKSL